MIERDQPQIPYGFQILNAPELEQIKNFNIMGRHLSVLTGLVAVGFIGLQISGGEFTPNHMSDTFAVIMGILSTAGYSITNSNFINTDLALKNLETPNLESN